MNQLRRLETRPLTSRTRDLLFESIEQGVFVDGWLPREEKLASEIGVSRTTVRAALRSLEEQGLITRQRGVGTRVNEHVARAPITLNRAIGYWDLITEAGHDPGIGWTKVTTGVAPAGLAQRLGCAPEEQLILVDRLYLADGQPAVHVLVAIDRDDVVGPLDDVARSIFDLAEASCRSKIDHTVVEIIPMVADAAIAQLLSIDVGDPLLRLIETHYSIEGNPFLVGQIHVVDRFIRFNVVRRLL